MLDYPSQTAKAFYAFMHEREKIRLRKEAGQPPPWTTDSILQEYKFTNVHRHHDWTSAKLIELFYKPNFNAPQTEILMNSALFRYFGTVEFARAVGWQLFDYFDFDGIQSIAKDRLAAKQRVFTGAYVITNQGISAPKQEVVTQYFLRDLYAAAEEIVALVQKTRKWRTVADRMRSIKGFGGSGFMTKEILLDTTYTNFWSNPTIYGFSFPDDWNRWTPIGPGARRGVARLLGYDDPSTCPRMNESAMLKVIWALTEDQIRYGWWDQGPYLAPTDIQFQLCEFDKYERVRLGQGRPRSKYRPRRA